MPKLNFTKRFFKLKFEPPKKKKSRIKLCFE